ncbi:MAG TPA: 4Fe-4S binding protein [Atribacteraceae bacterium]|nr:4Fe-4S binding protein [Atribacteraceae bacterium]
MTERKTKRSIITIDEEKCNGCGLCATACAEGAIEIRQGKARLVSDSYCDGLGACLDECPQNAIRIVEREAESFDAAAVEKHLSRKPTAGPPLCPGSLARTLFREDWSTVPHTPEEGRQPSLLGNWPVQITLVSPQAPYLKGAPLVIAADCTAFAYRDFHRSFLPGKILLIGCPKLDDGTYYLDKLTEMFTVNQPVSGEVVYMEVPCCGGLVKLVEEARRRSGITFPLTLTKIGINGGIIKREVIQSAESRVQGSKPQPQEALK